jgi:TorA maturation chaperone TorD
MTTDTEPIFSSLQPYFQSRKNFYQLLYLLFQEPNKHNCLNEIARDNYIHNLADIHEGGKILSQFFYHFSEEQLQEEQTEYQRLFIGPGPLVAPPWESYYRSKEHLLFEECTYEIRKEYHKFGLQFVRENNEPDDHLLLELEFMIFLIDLAMENQEVVRTIDLISTQTNLIQNHLSKWVPFFCERLIENTNSQLYLGAGMLLDDFLAFDIQSLNEIKGALLHV